ncbi:MAG: HIT domain-containing protein [Clostridiales bacterium]|nr:HIT domain-containing protein [Clostridiales bacterium]
MEYNLNLNELDVEKLKKLSPGELTDLGICPTCFDRATNKSLYGDDSQLKTYEDDDIECLFVPNPRAKGHMMISTKTHYHDMAEAPDYINEKIVRFAKAYMNIIKQVYGCVRVYLCTMADGPMNHYHVQLIPRYDHEERGSKNFVKPRQKYVYQEESFNQVCKLINEYAKKQI